MNTEEFNKIKATFPWAERVVQTGMGGLIQVFDKNGNEVPILTMVAFLSMITRKLAQQTEAEVTP
jgi:hypothetical protein